MTNTILSPLTLAVAILTTAVKAHGYVQGVVADGIYHQGYRPNFQYLASPPQIPSWSDPLNINNGYVSNYTSPDIICHLGATPGKTYAVVQAGGEVQLQWTDWPIGHLGPVVTYLANCNGNCTNVDKTKLLFNKIDEAGLIQGGYSPGKWAADELIANNNSWTVQIPKDIAPGQYVLRHEIISLQEAMVYGGAQNYPQCVNLIVTGSGSNSLQNGTLGAELYTHDDPGIHIDIYRALSNYTIPGPALISSASNTTQPSINNFTTSLMTSLTSTSASTSTSMIIPTTDVGQAFYSVSQTMATSTSTTVSSTSGVSTSTSVQNSTTSASSITTMISTDLTTLQTITRSNTSVTADVSTVTIGGGVSTTLVEITVTVPGNFADTPTTTDSTTPTVYPLTIATSLALGPMANATWTFPNGTATAYPTGSGVAWPTGTGSIYPGTGTGSAMWTEATMTSAPIDNGYQPRRNVRSVRQRYW